MKLVLCTLAICLSVLASVFTLSDLVRTESRKTRGSIPKALTEPLDPAAREASVIQKLDAINAQLISVNKRLSLLEEGDSGRSARAAAGAGTADSTQADILALTKSVNGIGASLARLGGVPSHLAELTTYLDRSFEHIEKALPGATASQDLLTSINQMAGKIDAIDGYFTPLYTFLGLSSDSDTQDLLAAYPSIDERINDLSLQIEAVHKEVAEIHYLIVPHAIEPTQHSR